MTACICNLAADPACPADHERAGLDIAEVKDVLRGLRSFRADAIAECSLDALDALERCRRAHDLTGFRAQRTAILDTHADALIDAVDGWHGPSAAAHIVKRRYQRIEREQFSSPTAARFTPVAAVGFSQFDCEAA